MYKKEVLHDPRVVIEAKKRFLSSYIDGVAHIGQPKAVSIDFMLMGKGHSYDMHCAINDAASRLAYYGMVQGHDIDLAGVVNELTGLNLKPEDTLRVRTLQDNYAAIRKQMIVEQPESRWDRLADSVAVAFGERWDPHRQYVDSMMKMFYSRGYDGGSALELVTAVRSIAANLRVKFQAEGNLSKAAEYDGYLSSTESFVKYLKIFVEGCSTDKRRLIASIKRDNARYAEEAKAQRAQAPQLFVPDLVTQ